MNKCEYCGYEPRSFSGSLKNYLQGHNCPIYDVTKLSNDNTKSRRENHSKESVQ